MSCRGCASYSRYHAPPGLRRTSFPMIHPLAPPVLRMPCPRRPQARWLRSAIACIALAAGTLAAAQAQDDTGPLVVAPAQLRLGIEKVELPGHEKMGLVGTT